MGMQAYDGDGDLVYPIFDVNQSLYGPFYHINGQYGIPTLPLRDGGQIEQDLFNSFYQYDQSWSARIVLNGVAQTIDPSALQRLRQESGDFGQIVLTPLGPGPSLSYRALQVLIFFSKIKLYLLARISC